MLLLLTGLEVYPPLLVAFGNRPYLDRKRVDVGEVLPLFFADFPEQVRARRYFYRSAPLSRDGLVSLSSYFGDLNDACLEIDRRMLDYLLGLDTVLGDLVDGSHLYYPSTPLDQVVIPARDKDLVLRMVRTFETVRARRRHGELGDDVGYGDQMVILFHGPSGTGKTMLANAIAHEVAKPVLLANWPSLGLNESDELLRFLFREAKVHDALLFLDECDVLLGERERGNHALALLLTELERHDGLVVMATNRPAVLDEALYRRVTLAVKFSRPDPDMREEIWRKHLPRGVAVAEGVDLGRLAAAYELTGGLIRNAVKMAVAMAFERDPARPVLDHERLVEGAKTQLRWQLRSLAGETDEVPRHGLEAPAGRRPLRHRAVAST